MSGKGNRAAPHSPRKQKGAAPFGHKNSAMATGAQGLMLVGGKMKRLLLGIALTATGCDDPEVVYVELGCSRIPEPKNLAAGERCATDLDCASYTCLPSNTTQFAVSYCFDRNVDGCMVVTEPFEFASQCTKPFGKVYACGDAWDISTLGQCDDVGIGKLGETYRCCTPEMP